jgi:hypothetical protein
MVRSTAWKLRALSTTAMIAILLGLAGVQAPAYASAAPSDSTKTIGTFSVGDPQFPNDNVVRFFNDGIWPVGDCVMSNFSYVEVDLTTRRVLLHGITSTSHTNNADVWHSTFLFQNGSGNNLSVGPLDSARMTLINRNYVWDVSVPIVGSAPIPNFTQVRWTSHC